MGQGRMSRTKDAAKKRQQKRLYYEKYRKSEREPFLCNRVRMDRIIPPSEVLAERERYLNAEYGSLSAAILGDPKRGYSALDKKAQ